MEERFQKFIAQCKSIYDLVFMDCHPAGSLFTKTSLRNSDHVLIPVVPQRYSQRGIGLMMDFIAAKSNPGTAPTPHILFNATPRNGIAIEETEIRANAEYAPNWQSGLVSLKGQMLEIPLSASFERCKSRGSMLQSS
jgi:chromosome partitioning protein